MSLIQFSHFLLFQILKYSSPGLPRILTLNVALDPNSRVNHHSHTGRASIPLWRPPTVRFASEIHVGILRPSPPMQRMKTATVTRTTSITNTLWRIRRTTDRLQQCACGVAPKVGKLDSWIVRRSFRDIWLVEVWRKARVGRIQYWTSLNSRDDIIATYPRPRI